MVLGFISRFISRPSRTPSRCAACPALLACPEVHPPDRAIWLEAAEEQWAVASTLAHVAVATHYTSGVLWQQWLDLEEMRGNVESLFRLRALASAAGVRLTGTLVGRDR